MNDDQAGSDRRRIEALENVVRAMVADQERLRNEVRALRGEAPKASAASPKPATPSWDPPAGAPSPDSGRAGVASQQPQSTASAPPRPAPARPSAAAKAMKSGDLEQLIGRYGTVGVATLAILLGLGAFLQWAITRGLLGPEMRVALGAVAAMVLALLGFRIRGKGSVKFGNALLAIALAVVHVVAWGAGPTLGLVPPKLALFIAAIASGALAALALRDADEFLFILGLGGAMIAPFVTSTGDSEVVLLLVYGGVVLTASIVAMRETSWDVAPRLISASALAYGSAATGSISNTDGRPHLMLPAAFALSLAAVGVAVGARGVRRTLVRDLILVLVIMLFIVGAHDATPRWNVPVYAFMGLFTLHALRRRLRWGDERDEREEATGTDIVGMPFILLLTAIISHEMWSDSDGSKVSAAWAAAAGLYYVIDPIELRGKHLALLLASLLLGAFASLYEREVASVAAAAVVAVASAYAIASYRDRALLLPLLLAHFLSAGLAWSLIDDRIRWTYTPFADSTSFAALCAVAALIHMSRTVPQALFSERTLEGPWGAHPVAHLMRAIGPVAAFLWIREEFAHFRSADLAAFVLITYYAVVGIGTIVFGRRREIAVLRQVGLVLSLYAALKAVVESSGLNVGLRVGSYLVVGAFLLAVGYLYRGRSSAE